MTNWGFSDRDGYSITRGWQGTANEAEAYAQKLANARGTPVDYWDETDKSGARGEGEPADSLCTVDPVEAPIEITAQNARPTDTGVNGAMDVYVEITMDGREICGDVTMVRHELTGEWVPYGNAADYWVSGRMLRELSDLRSGQKLCELLAKIARVAGEAIDA